MDGSQPEEQAEERNGRKKKPQGKSVGKARAACRMRSTHMHIPAAGDYRSSYRDTRCSIALSY